ncbi:MAG: 50S ribosomal protein L22 [Candidatus Lokiarchaeota archaeon]|nr:50S ribosomal protein L22 [Candidatus Lokiarchaeota archaeon]MBD3337970.1 50S ribosomal protein L22 [Candidatus Lokiarchaeota archaeon]
MPNWKYAFTEQKYDTDRIAKASGRDLRIKPKHAREICAVIKGMMLEKAKEYLEKVIRMDQSVPFRRYKKKTAHKKDLKQFKWYAGKYPRKAAARIYEILTAVESNAEYKGLDIDFCRIIHAATHKGRIIKRFIERAHGRSTPHYKHLSHVEIVVYEFPS